MPSSGDKYPRQNHCFRYHGRPPKMRRFGCATRTSGDYMQMLRPDPITSRGEGLLEHIYLYTGMQLAYAQSFLGARSLKRCAGGQSNTTSRLADQLGLHLHIQLHHRVNGHRGHIKWENWIYLRDEHDDCNNLPLNIMTTVHHHGGNDDAGGAYG